MQIHTTCGMGSLHQRRGSGQHDVLLQEERSKTQAAAELTALHEAAAAEARERVALVEAEMRALLTALQRHKGASAAKMRQLAAVLQDLQVPFGLASTA